MQAIPARAALRSGGSRSRSSSGRGRSSKKGVSRGGGSTTGVNEGGGSAAAASKKQPRGMNRLSSNNLVRPLSDSAPAADRAVRKLIERSARNAIPRVRPWDPSASRERHAAASSTAEKVASGAQGSSSAMSGDTSLVVADIELIDGVPNSTSPRRASLAAAAAEAAAAAYVSAPAASDDLAPLLEATPLAVNFDSAEWPLAAFDSSTYDRFLDNPSLWLKEDDRGFAPEYMSNSAEVRRLAAPVVAHPSLLTLSFSVD